MFALLFATGEEVLMLSERIVRVEEGLLRVEEAGKNQNLMTDKRFEVLTMIDKEEHRQRVNRK